MPRIYEDVIVAMGKQEHAELICEMAFSVQ
jgi:hypothetical protein